MLTPKHPWFQSCCWHKSWHPIIFLKHSLIRSLPSLKFHLFSDKSPSSLVWLKVLVHTLDLALPSCMTWARYETALCLRLLICKMGVVMVPPTEGSAELTHVCKTWERFLAQSWHSTCMLARLLWMFQTHLLPVPLTKVPSMYHEFLAVSQIPFSLFPLTSGCFAQDSSV